MIFNTRYSIQKAKELINIDKKQYLCAAIGVLLAFIIGIGTGWYMCSREQTDNGSGIEQTGTYIRQAGERQSEAAESIDRTGKSLDSIKTGIEQSQAINDGQRGTIAEGQQILRTIRARGAKN